MTEKAKQTRRGNGGTAARNGAPAEGNSVTEQTEAMVTMNAMAIETFTKACQAYLNGWATLNGELAGFMAKRLNHDAELGSSLARCESWEEAAELQRDWARVTAEEYAAEASRLMELTSEMTAEVTAEQWKPVWAQAEKAVADVKKATH